VRKETEMGDFRPDAVREQARGSEEQPEGGAEAPTDPSSCPWHFGDTLTFAATRADILGAGVQVWLKTQGEVRFGPLFQVNMSNIVDVGMCSVDLRRRVLPACVQRAAALDGGGSSTETHAAGGPFIWESPVMVLPLTHVGNGKGPGDKLYVLGESAGHVALSFGVNMDPELLLKSADEATMPLVHRVAQPLKEWTVKTAGAGVNAAAEWTAENAPIAAAAARDWTVKAAGVTATVVQAAAVSTHQVTQESVKWVMENTDIEGCTTKTRDRATRHLEDLCGQQMLQDATPVFRKPDSVCGPVVRQHMSPTKMSVATTSFGQTPSPRRVPSISSGQPSFGFPGTPVSRAIAAGVNEQSPHDARLGSQVQGEKEQPHLQPVMSGSVSAPPRAAGISMVRAAQMPLPPPPPAGAVASSGRAASAAVPPGAPKPVRPAGSASAAAPAGGAKVAHYVTQLPMAQPGLPTRQSFPAQVPGCVPSRQSFQVVQMVPYSQQALPTRQSFQVAQAQSQVLPAQYVRPSTVY